MNCLSFTSLECLGAQEGQGAICAPISNSQLPFILSLTCLECIQVKLSFTHIMSYYNVTCNTNNKFLFIFLYMISEG